jgi:hypothetical protein
LPEEPNYFAHAFKSQYNLIGLGTALGFAFLAASAFPLILAAGAQLVILPLVAGSERFRRLVRARVSSEAQEVKQERQAVETGEILKTLPDAERQRYRGLETLAAEIRRNYQGLDASSRMLLEELIEKLEFLLSFYLRMRSSVARYEAYFSTTDPDQIEERIAMLGHEIERGPERIQSIKARTKAVLEKRLVRYKKALENKQLIDAQTETVLEVVQLLRDQSFSIRDPREITSQLDGLVSSAEETERGVRDMEDILSAEQDLLLPGAMGEDIEEELRIGEAKVKPAAAGPAAARPVPAAPHIRVDPPALAASPPPPPRKKLVQ